MRLFHVQTVYHLEVALLYLNKHGGIDFENDWLLVFGLLYDRHPKLQDTHLFKHIIRAELNMGKYGGYFEYYNNLFEQHQVCITDFEEILIAGSQGYFAHYVVENQCEFSYFEEAVGMLSMPENLINMDLGAEPNRANKSLEYGLYTAENELISKIVCNFSYQNKEIVDLEAKHFEHFDLGAELLLISKNMMTEIIRIFEVPPQLEIKNNTAMIFTQHFANLKQGTFEDQITLYQYFVDYLIRESYENIAFKIHPSDVMYYKRLFPQSLCIRERFPSEFLPLISTQRPALATTVWSTAIDNLNEFYDEKLVLSYDYLASFKDSHQYYVAAKIAQYFKQIDDVYTIGLDNIHFDTMVCQNKLYDITYNPTHREHLEEHIPETRFVIINSNKDMLPINYRRFLEQHKGVVLFLTPQKNYKFYDIQQKEYWLANSVVIDIDKKILREEDNYSLIERELLFLCSKDKEVLKMAKEFTHEKHLEYSGIDISVPKHSKEEWRMIALERILETTERRLEYEIEQSRKLSKEIETLTKINERLSQKYAKLKM